MQQFDQAQAATTTAINSAGSAYRENEQFLQSLESRLNRVSNSFTNFSIQMADALLTDGIVLFADSLVSISNSVSSLIQRFGLLPPVFTAVTAAIMLFSTKAKTSMATSLVSVSNLVGISNVRLNQMSLSLNKLAYSFGLSANAARGFVLAARSIATIALPIAGFMALGIAVEKLISHFGKLKESQRELEAINKAIINSISNQTEAIDNLLSRYEKLSGINNRTVEQDQEYLQISNELASLLPNLVQHIDDKGQAHLKSADAIKEELEYARELMELERRDRVQNSIDVFKDQVEDVKEATKELDKLKRRMVEIEEIQADLDSGQIINLEDLDKLDDVYKIEALIKSKEQEIARFARGMRDNIASLTSDILSLAEVDVSSNVVNQISIFSASLENVSRLSEKQLSNISFDIANFIRDIQHAIKSGNDSLQTDLEITSLADELIAKYPEAVNEVHSLVDSLKNIGDAIEEQAQLYPVFDDLGNHIGDITSVADKAAEAFENLTAEIDKDTGALIGFTGALKESTESTWENITATELLLGITSDQTKQLKQAIEVVAILTQMENLNAQQKEMLAGATEYLESIYPHLSGRIAENIEFLFEEAQALDLLNSQSNLTAEALIANQDDTTIATLRAIDERINGYNKELEALDKLQQVLTRDLDIDPYNWDGLHELARQIEGIESNLAGEYESRRNLLYGSGVIERPKDKENKAKETKTVDPYEIDEYTNSIQYLDTQIKLIDGKMSRLSQTSDEYSKALNDQIYLMNVKQKKMAEERQSIDAQILKLKEQLEVTKDVEKQNDIKKQIESLTSTKQSLQTSWWDIDIDKHSKIFERQMINFQQLSKEIEEYDHQLALSQAIQSKHQEGTVEWNNELIKQNKVFHDKRAILLEQISTLEKLLETGKLFPPQEEEVQKELRKTRLEYENLNQSIDGFIDTLNKQMDLDLSELTAKYEALNKELEKLLNPKATFDYRQFHQTIADIVATLDSIDERYLQGVSFIDTTDSARSNLSNMKQDIIDIARTVEQMANSSSTNSSQLESMIRNQINYANSLKSQLDDVNNTIRERQRLYKQEEEALQNQIKNVSNYYDQQIEAQRKKLKALDEEIEKEDRLQKLKDINDEIDKTKNDKRYSYITEDGEEIFTYNKARVNELEKQRNDMLKQFEREDLKKAINDEIERLQKLKDDTVKELQDKLEKTRQIHQAEIDSLRMYADNLSQLHGLIVSDTQEKMNQLKELQEQEKKEYEEHWKDLIEKAKNGTIEFEELMVAWQNTSLDNLNSYVNGFESEVSRLSGIIASMRSMASEASSLSASIASSAASAQTSIGSAPKPSGSLKKYHTGGIVGGASNRLTELANKIFNTNPNETVIKSLVGELQIPPNNIKNNFIPNMQKIINSIQPRMLQVSSPEGGVTYNLYNPQIIANNPMDLWKQIGQITDSKKK